MTPYLVANLLGDLFNAVLFLGAGAFGVWFQHRRAQAKTASGTIDLLSVRAQELRHAIMDLEAFAKVHDFRDLNPIAHDAMEQALKVRIENCCRNLHTFAEKKL